ncbi:MAG TPA: TfoX/Sxy family protein [Lysobacter sp.]|nr:TfoX/Sxy family protein [Lysobacter sp.]
MATDADFVDYIAEQAGLGERLTRKKMFGEYALYLDGKVVAFVCDNSLFIKPTAAVEQLAPDLPLRPPYPVAKPYPVADELLDDSEALQRLLIRTAALLPVPRPRTKKSPKKKPATPRQARP